MLLKGVKLFVKWVRFEKGSKKGKEIIMGNRRIDGWFYKEVVFLGEKNNYEKRKSDNNKDGGNELFMENVEWL